MASVPKLGGSLLIAIPDTSSIELRVSLSGRNVSSSPETRLGLNLLRPQPTSPITACITPDCSYESSTIVVSARRRVVSLADAADGLGGMCFSWTED